MSIKILGGMARGFNLSTPKADTTKPTSVLVRRKIFDWRQNLSGYYFIDLFAGSGAIGFEALSRGAEKVILNDSLKLAWSAMKQNKESFSAAFKIPPDQLHIFNHDALAWINKELAFQFPDTSEVILYLDPPYEKHGLYLQVLDLLREKAFAGEVWVESDRLKGPPLAAISGAFGSIIKTIEHGDHFVVIGKLV